MAPKIFLTGATGYIGGSVFATLARKHPEYEISVLMRNPPPSFASQYPKVKVIKADFDSAEVIKDAAAIADIVVNSGNADHQGLLNSIIAGLISRPSGGHLIHLSGTGVLYDITDTKEFCGRYNSITYSDIKDIDKITSRPLNSVHRRTDVIIQNAAEAHGDKLKTAIVCPPDIYGHGHGPGKTVSWYIPLFVQETKKFGAPFYVNEGTNARGWVHVDDLSSIFLALVEKAAAQDDSVTWGKHGYFLASTQEYSQKEVAERAASLLHKRGLLSSADTKGISEDDLDRMGEEHNDPQIGYFTFASNSRSIAERAAKELGYKPNGPTLWDVLESDMMDSYKS